MLPINMSELAVICGLKRNTPATACAVLGVKTYLVPNASYRSYCEIPETEQITSLKYQHEKGSSRKKEVSNTWQRCIYPTHY